MYRPIALSFLLSIFALTLSNQIVIAQDSSKTALGKITVADFDLPKINIIDSSTDAVILSEKGTLEFTGNNVNWVSYVRKISVRIRILKKKGYELATSKIRLNGRDKRQDQVSDFEAATFNLENGKVVETRLSDKDIFTENISKNVTEKKFTMPDVKEGSIIGYSYTITSYHYYYLPTWYFQYLEYPCLHSEFTLAMPDLLRYMTIRYGIDSFYSFTSGESSKTLVMRNVNVKTNIHTHTWVMNDIAPFKSEDHINEPLNYVDKLEFSLAQTYNGEDIENVQTTWKGAEDDLLHNGSFGLCIDVDRASNLYNTMQKVCMEKDDVMQATKHLYNYVRDNFTCVPDNDILVNDLYEINKHHKGSVAELNMLLIALLRQRGIKADPVILTTTDFGNHPESYPIIEKMNYVICMVRFGRDTTYLDASDPLLGFGKLPLRCYNGHAQVINEQHSGSVYFYPASIKESDKTYITIINNETGNGATGSLENVCGYIDSYKLRNDIKKSGLEAFQKKVQGSYGNEVNIKNLKIDSLNMLDEPVKINCDLDFKALAGDDIIYFNPVINNSSHKNPFTGTKRKYPVELPYPIDEVYELTMDIPKGYNVDELPKPVRVNLNATDGFFEYRIQKDEYVIQLRTHINVSQTLFAPEDYQSLRDFFAYVIKKESEQIVFKKK
jgi:Domain of Unknown Function with PDB structure (DUF3858)/Domain of Unknown Function with PDB structure (DUF3857)